VLNIRQHQCRHMSSITNDYASLINPITSQNSNSQVLFSKKACSSINRRKDMVVLFPIHSATLQNFEFRFQKEQNLNTLQNDLFTIQEWSSEMQLSLSVTRCTILRLGFRKKTVPRLYSIGDINLGHVPFMRDLGVIMSNVLKWPNHCAITAKKASIRMNYLFQSFESKLTIFYCTLIKLLFDLNWNILSSGHHHIPKDRESVCGYWCRLQLPNICGP
jgi:hypothetical protein